MPQNPERLSYSLLAETSAELVRRSMNRPQGIGCTLDLSRQSIYLHDATAHRKYGIRMPVMCRAFQEAIPSSAGLAGWTAHISIEDGGYIRCPIR